MGSKRFGPKMYHNFMDIFYCQFLDLWYIIESGVKILLLNGRGAA